MKFSAETLSVLKNFSTINPGIVFRPGSVIRTVHPQKTIMASAVISENIESVARVFDLSQFLSTLQLFQSPEVKFNEDHFVISDEKSNVKYTYAAEAMVVTIDKNIAFPPAEAKVTVTWKDLDSVIKAAGILKLPEVAFIGEGDKIKLSAVNSKNPTADSYHTTIASGEDYGHFEMLINVENFKLVPNDYEVALSKRGLAHFKSNKIEYFIALKAK